MPTITTTLQAIRDAKPCKEGYMKLRRHLGMDFPMDKRFNVLRVLESNGKPDLEWVLVMVRIGPAAGSVRDRFDRWYLFGGGASLSWYVDEHRPRIIAKYRQLLSPSRKKKPAKAKRPAKQRRAA